jgi:altronate dehydratase
MSRALPFADVARLAESSDNVAIAIRRLEAGTRVLRDGHELTLGGVVIEGHRFALAPIRAEEPLLSWGLPFGLALCDIAPGDYVCNEKCLAELRRRSIDFPLPDTPNFKDHRITFALDEAAFRPGVQVPPADEPRTFDGYLRDGGRGVGTRNYVVVLGTSSRTGGFARALAGRFTGVRTQFPNLDGVAAVAHTEGGGPVRPNNLDLTLRTLAGFMVHPNVAAVLAVDLGSEPVTNALLREFLRQGGYPLDAVPHHFLTAQGGFETALREGERIVRGWLPAAAACARAPQPVAQLRLALQCGGSDAFSGVSGNPLSGWVAKEIIRHGGAANLAETSELIGAEPYVLANVRDLATARKFLRQCDRFQEWAGWHGHSAEGNPSGGNLYRGLYNIVIKSIGAARKKDPAVRLDHCLDYAEPMREPGFHFMDSPGNDLESIAGQVASGCNVIHFITGNGSITNFPFVPTVKVVTTTGRYELLRKEMDVNAGRYLDGMPLDGLGRETFEHTLRIVSGERSVGERAGHSQVQLWRDWAQTDATQLPAITQRPQPTGEPLKLNRADNTTHSDTQSPLTRPSDTLSPHPMRGEGRGEGCSREGRVPPSRPFAAQRANVGLIVPTSLCAGQIALMIATRLNAGLRVIETEQPCESALASSSPPSPSPQSSPQGRGSDIVRRSPSETALNESSTAPEFLPLPQGEGWGEGEGTKQISHPVSHIEQRQSVSLPMRFVALPHTEGCGNSRGESEALYLRTMTSYLRHPLVARALLLEHGCEKTHNDEMRAFMADHGLDSSRCGFASIQLAGGIEAVTKKVMEWFQGAATGVPPIPEKAAPMRLGIAMEGDLFASVAEALARLAEAILAQGGTVVLPVSADSAIRSPQSAIKQSLLTSAATRICKSLGAPAEAPPTLAYGQFVEKPGFHLMETPTAHLVETITGLGATGVDLIIAHVGSALAQGHPLVPVLQIAAVPLPDIDAYLDPTRPPQSLADELAELVARTVAGEHQPRAWRLGNVDFQVTRGLVGVSL